MHGLLLIAINLPIAIAIAIAIGRNHYHKQDVTRRHIATSLAVLPLYHGFLYSYNELRNDY